VLYTVSLSGNACFLLFPSWMAFFLGYDYFPARLQLLNHELTNEAGTRCQPWAQSLRPRGNAWPRPRPTGHGRAANLKRACQEPLGVFPVRVVLFCGGALFVDFVNCEVNTNVFIMPVMSSLHSSSTKQSARLVIFLKFVIAEPLQICINRE
jgi:hypothetical protein